MSTKFNIVRSVEFVAPIQREYGLLRSTTINVQVYKETGSNWLVRLDPSNDPMIELECEHISEVVEFIDEYTVLTSSEGAAVRNALAGIADR